MSRKGGNGIFILDLRKHFFFDDAVLGNGDGLLEIDLGVITATSEK